MLREIAAAFGVCVTSAHKYVRTLERKGYLAVEAHAHRGIRLTRGRREWKVREEWRGDFEKRIGARLRDETDLARVFVIVRDEVRPWLDVGSAELFVHDAHRRELRGVEFFDIHHADLANPGGGDRSRDPLMEQALRRRKTANEAGHAAVPVIGRDRILGVLRLEEARPGRDMDEVKIARAAMAAAAIAPALEQGTLNAELRRRIRLQSALIALVRSINSAADFQKIVRDIYAIVGDLVDAPYFMIAVKNDDGQWLLLMETDHVDGRVFEDYTPHPVPIDHMGLRVLKDQPYYIQHRTPEEIRVLEAKGRQPSKEGWNPVGVVEKRSRSILCVRLISGGEMIGYVSAQSYRYNAYSVRDAEDLLLIGKYIGLALQNAWRRDRRWAELEGEIKQVVAATDRDLRPRLEALARKVVLQR